MKSYRLFFFIGLTILSFSCDNSDDLVQNLHNNDQVVLNSSVEVIASTEETAENVIDLLDYEIDLYSFIESEYQPQNENFFYEFHNDLTAWNRYQWGRFPAVNLETTAVTRYPLKLKLNYTDQIAFHNGKVIEGNVEITFNNPVLTANATREIVYKVKIDQIEIEGVKNITTQYESDGNLKFLTQSEIKFLFPDTTILYRTDDREKIWQGFATFFDTSDDVVTIKGKTTCVDTEQNEYIKSIDDQQSLVQTDYCYNLYSGIVTYSQNEINFATVSFGNGGCSELATLKYKEGNTEIIKTFVVGTHNRGN